MKSIEAVTAVADGELINMEQGAAGLAGKASSATIIVTPVISLAIQRFATSIR